MYKILLIDHCYFSRLGMVGWLNHSEYFASPFEITATDHLLRAREYIMQWQPDMVIADLHGFMSDIHHISQLSSIFAACGKHTRLLLLQSGMSEALEHYCETHKPWQTVEKSVPLGDLKDIIEQAMQTRPQTREARTVTSLLTLREERILKWWTDGIANEVIARNMGIAVKTVYTYKRNIRMKLGVDNRFSLFVPQHELRVE